MTQSKINIKREKKNSTPPYLWLVTSQSHSSSWGNQVSDPQMVYFFVTVKNNAIVNQLGVFIKYQHTERLPWALAEKRNRNSMERPSEKQCSLIQNNNFHFSALILNQSQSTLFLMLILLEWENIFFFFVTSV